MTIDYYNTATTTMDITADSYTDETSVVCGGGEEFKKDRHETDPYDAALIKEIVAAERAGVVQVRSTLPLNGKPAYVRKTNKTTIHPKRDKGWKGKR